MWASLRCVSMHVAAGLAIGHRRCSLSAAAAARKRAHLSLEVPDGGEAEMIDMKIPLVNVDVVRSQPFLSETRATQQTCSDCLAHLQPHPNLLL